jgi:hypothetical protein
MADVYRDSFGQFASADNATFKEVDGKHFVLLFGMWTQLKPVTPETFAARMRVVAEAQQRAM